MLRQRLSEQKFSPYRSTPRRSLHNFDTNDENPILSEWKLSLCGLLLSILIIIGKLYYSNLDYLKSLFLEQKLISYKVLSEDGEVMFKYIWKSVVKYSDFWLPIFCGFLSTYFTWIMVYLDSQVPGVQPPSPFSPSKYKTRSGHSFHLNYIFAVLVGFLVTFYMFWKQISIQF